MSKQEYSEGVRVRELVRAVGRREMSAPVEIDALYRAIEAGLIEGLFTPGLRLTDKGRELLREMQDEEPERLYPMGKQQPAQIDCRREYCKYHMYGRCTNPAPAITLNGPPSMTNEKGVCWAYKAREPEPSPDPLCPVCGKPASEHKSGLFWGYKGHTNKSGIWMGRILARLCRTGQQQGVAARNHPAHQAMRGAAMTDRLSDRR